jgi:pyruvate/2-oxoglutarate dehydrogenase complex dihydrolipoamide acyltransferase (E2) component
MTSAIDVAMPQMGVSVSEGTVVCWHKEVGDRVEQDEPICDISTDKVDTECPSPVAGVIAEILVEMGATVDVGTVLARITSDTPVSEDTPARGAPARGEPRSSPVARRIAAEHDIDLADVAGSARGGRITKQDVLAFAERRSEGPSQRPMHSESPYRPDAAASAAPATSTAASAGAALGGVSEPLSRMRQIIGVAMRRSLDTAATCHTIVECDMSQVERRRREQGLTALPLVARATIEALSEFPDLNATLDGTTITRYERVHLGIAVSLGAGGLIVPVIRDSQDLAVEGLGRRIRELAGSARAERLSPDDVQGATFTITNPGSYGALAATPIINAPQVAILDLEAVTRRPVVVADADGQEGIAIRSMVNLCLGWDHRAVDGAYAAQFLTALRRRLESL